MADDTQTPDDQGGSDLPTTNRGQTPNGQSTGTYSGEMRKQMNAPITRNDLAYMYSMPQAFAASSQLAFGKQEAKGKGNQ